MVKYIALTLLVLTLSWQLGWTKGFWHGFWQTLNAPSSGIDVYYFPSTNGGLTTFMVPR